jgi:hypothetical protein
MYGGPMIFPTGHDGPPADVRRSTRCPPVYMSLETQIDLKKRRTIPAMTKPTYFNVD